MQDSNAPQSHKCDENELLQKVLANDTQAKLILKQRYVDPAKRILQASFPNRSISSTVESAKDRVLLASHQGTPVRTSLFGLLYTVAKRGILRRENKSKGVQSLDTINETFIPSSANEVIEAVQIRESMAILQETINAMSEPGRTYLILMYSEQLTSKEAAEQMGIPQQTFVSRFKTARKLLKEKLSMRGVSLSNSS